MSGAGSPFSVAALDAERERLLAEQADLLRELPGMHPLVGARAATVLEEKLAALEREYETLSCACKCAKREQTGPKSRLLKEEQHGRVN